MHTPVTFGHHGELTSNAEGIEVVAARGSQLCLPKFLPKLVR
jgi:hypothetical protein